MKCAVVRFDATYAMAFEPAFTSLVGAVPEFLVALYDAFHSRYPSIISVDVFRALNASSLAEVGVKITLLSGKINLEIRVDKMTLVALNLNSPDEISFARDSLYIARDVVAGRGDGFSAGRCDLRLATWLSVDGGALAGKDLLSKVVVPTREIDVSKLGAEKVFYQPRVNVINEKNGWQLTALLEPSVVPGSDLFLIRDFAFFSGNSVGGAEQQFSLVENTTPAIFDWLGLLTPTAFGQ
jgi:hypothetical protein